MFSPPASNIKKYKVKLHDARKAYCDLKQPTSGSSGKMTASILD